MNTKKVIISTSIVVSIILIFSILFSLLVSNYNKNLKNKKLNIVIYQYHTSVNLKLEQPIIYYQNEFTNELNVEMKIYALDGDKEHGYNYVVIKDGVVRVIDADCKEERCMHTIIDLNNKSLSLINPNTTTIECKPNGLKITLEEIK